MPYAKKPKKTKSKISRVIKNKLTDRKTAKAFKKELKPKGKKSIVKKK